MWVIWTFKNLIIFNYKWFCGLKTFSVTKLSGKIIFVELGDDILDQKRSTFSFHLLFSLTIWQIIIKQCQISFPSSFLFSRTMSKCQACNQGVLKSLNPGSNLFKNLLFGIFVYCVVSWIQMFFVQVSISRVFKDSPPWK